MECITSRSNPLITHIRKLTGSKTARRQAGEMVCEGPKMLEEALKCGAEVTTVVAERGTVLPGGLPEKIRSVEVPSDLLHAIAPTQTPQNLLFLCTIPTTVPPEGLPQGRYLVLDGLQDPGNVGTIWRTADALGADGVFLLGACADPWGPKTLRATMGACFRLPLWELRLADLLPLLKGAGIPLYATALREDTVDVRQADLSVCALVIGSEGRGVSQEVLAACASTLKIPMRPRCESLNAAAAAAVILWEMARQNG